MVVPDRVCFQNDYYHIMKRARVGSGVTTVNMAKAEKRSTIKRERVGVLGLAFALLISAPSSAQNATDTQTKPAGKPVTLLIGEKYELVGRAKVTGAALNRASCPTKVLNGGKRRRLTVIIEGDAREWRFKSPESAGSFALRLCLESQ